MALIGADGIWSAVRNHLFPEVQPQFSGLIAWRGTLDATHAAARIYRARGCSSGWGRTRIWSPIRSRRRGRSTWSRSCREPGTGRAGARPATPTKSRARSPRSAGPRPRGCWSAPSTNGGDGRCSPCPISANGRDGAIALLGDAAHAMLPFAAQGAGMAIEDAAVLAKCSERKPGRHYRRHPGNPEALWPAAARPRAAGAARRAATGADLSSHRTAGAGARPRHQGDGPRAHAGAAGLDL